MHGTPKKPNLSLWILLGLALVVFLVPVGLIAAYIWQAGLDLHSPKNVRHYFELCRRGHDDLYCKAIHAEIKQYSGPLTLLLADNTGDLELSARLNAYLAQYGYQPTDLLANSQVRHRFFLSHAFALPKLTTGTHRTLDGRAHRVTCRDGQSAHCQIDGLTAREYFTEVNRKADDGSLYFVSSIQKSGRFGQGFMPFLEGS